MPKALPLRPATGLADDRFISQVLLSISNDIPATRSKDGLIDVLSGRLKALVPFDGILITIFNEETGKHRIWAHSYYPKRKRHPELDAWLSAEYPAEDGVLDLIREQKGPVSFDLRELVDGGSAPDYIRYCSDNGLASMVGVMMRNARQDLGALFLTSRTKGTLRQEQLELIKGISSQISIAAANILANESIIKQEEDTAILLRLSSVIATVKDRQQLLDITREELKRSIPLNTVAVSFYDPKKGRHFIDSSLLQPEATGGNPLLDDADTIFGKEINNRIIHTRTIALFNVDELIGRGVEPPYIRWYRDTGVRQFAGVALRNGDNFLGCLYFGCKVDPLFATVNYHLIRGIADHLSSALINILAHEEILERETEKAMLLTISNDMAAIRNKGDLLSTLQKRLKKLFYFSHMLTTITDRETNTHSKFIVDPSSRSRTYPGYEKVVSKAYSLDDPMIRTVLHSRAPVVFDLDELAATGKLQEWVRMNHESGIVEMVMAPLFTGEELIGFFVLLSDRKQRIQEKELRLIQGISWQLSVAVANILANENLLERDNEKATLLALSCQIAVVRNKSELHQLINDKLKKLLPISHIITFRISEDGKWYSAYSLDPESISIKHSEYAKITSSQYLVEDGILDLVLASDKPLVYDLDEVVRRPFVPKYLRMNYDVGIKEAVLSSLKDGNNKTGILIILMKHKGDLGQNYLNLIQGISDQLSTAIANIRANEKIEQQLAEIDQYKKQLEDENLYLQEEIQTTHNYSEMIGTSQPMKKVFQLVSKVAGSDSSVLILGETGTGKELIARAIHSTSARKDKVMIKVNCAALPANLIESELFGHEKGSFTGAIERRIGKFELANNSTLFLDEVGELPLDLQVKLLRVLQEKEIERVGGRTTIKIDVRIIAATNRDLQKEILIGAFRSDLFFRLNVFPITIPALRDRREDIPLLATHFLVKHARKGMKGNMHFSSRVMKEMMAYGWPGNVRELEHLIERSILLTEGRTVEEVHLPGVEETDGFIPDDRVRTIDELERDYIISILRRCNGKISGVGGAAQLLKIPPTTLASKMLKLNIKRTL